MKNVINKEYDIKDFQVSRIENIDEIRKVVYDFDKVFEPPLSERVFNLDDYAGKLYRNAIVLVAKDDVGIIGFVAFYANDFNLRVCYLTQIAVQSRVQNNNIGKLLLDLCTDTSKNIGMTEIKLEVNNYNHRAFNFYKRNGFSFCGNASDDSKYMVKKL